MILRFISYLPLPVLYKLSDFLFVLIYYLFRYRYQVVRSNMLNSFPEKNEAEVALLVKQFYKNFCDYIVETIKAITISAEELERRVKFKDLQAMEGYLSKGTSVLALTSHQFNWEWLLLACSQRLSGQLNPVYKMLSSKYFDALMLRIRSRFGCQPVEMQQTLSKIFSQRKSTNVYGFLADQTPLPDADIYWSKFLGQDAAFFTGTERIAYLTKYPVVFIGIRRIKRGYYELNFERIAEPPYFKKDHAILDRYIARMEDQIRKSPSGWLWSHRRWKLTKPEALINQNG